MLRTNLFEVPEEGAVPFAQLSRWLARGNGLGT